jgi:hypothetical protein
LGDVMQDKVVLKRGDDFTHVADQATIDRERPFWESAPESLNALKDEAEPFIYGLARHCLDSVKGRSAYPCV